MAKKPKTSTLETLDAATLEAVAALFGLSMNDNLPARLQQKALTAARQLNAAHDAHFRPPVPRKKAAKR